MKKETLQKVGEWLVSEDTGQSSKYLLALILGAQPSRVHYPYDSSDIDRCFKMCERVGIDALDAFSLAAKTSKVWEGYAMNYSQLRSLWLEECVGDMWRAPKLYSFMQKIQDKYQNQASSE